MTPVQLTTKCLKIVSKFVCTFPSMIYNTSMIHSMWVTSKKPKPNKVERASTMSTTITLNKNRKNAAIFLARKTVESKKPVTDALIKEAAEKYMINHNPGPAVVEVIKAEAKRLLTASKGKATNLPEMPAPLGTEVKVAPVKPAKGKAAAAKKTVASKEVKAAKKPSKRALAK